VLCLMFVAGVISAQDTQGLIGTTKLMPLEIPTKPVIGERPKNWAVPLELEGVPNFYRVTDQLYRSAQPTEEGMKNLTKYGFETIISLRSLHSDREIIGVTGLGYERIIMQAWNLEEKDILRFLQLVTNPKRHPVLVHCQHGADRTGTVVAVYRIVVQDWEPQEAIREMKEGGYGYHTIWNTFVDRFFDKLETTKLKGHLESITKVQK